MASKDHLKSFKVKAFLLLGKFWLNLRFTPKYTTVGVERGYLNFLKSFNLIFLVSKDHIKSFKIVAFLLLGYFWLVSAGRLYSGYGRLYSGAGWLYSGAGRLYSGAGRLYFLG